MAIGEQQATAAYAPPDAGAPPLTLASVHAPVTHGTHERCPSCGGLLGADQRYCLGCGHRHGEPRLPFMNAVTFMESMKRPRESAPVAPQSRKRRGISPNAALIAGVATLLLAMGIGVMIGRSGGHTVASAPAMPQIIKVGGGAEAGATASTGKGAIGGAAAGGAAAAGPGGKKKAAALKKEAATGKGAEEVLKPAGNVKLPPATVQPGGKCESGTAGCKGGKYTGEFFGE